MRVIFMGTPEFAVLPLRRLVLGGYQVATVYTRPDSPAGRGRRLVPSPVKEAAQALSLTVVQPVSLKKAEAVAELAGFQPDLIVVAAFGQILPRAVLELPRFGCINVHASLLPRHRGASPVVAAILAGDDFTGVSIMLMDEGLDTGPVLTRAQVPISDRDNTGSLSSKLSLVSAHLLLDALPSWARGEISPRPQDEACATYAGMITKEAGEIDWRLPALDIWRRVRAYSPWPGCYTWWQGKALKIIEAEPLTGAGGVLAGQVVARSRSGFGVGTGDGILGVLTVQMEGKRAMLSEEFLRGQRQLVGAVLPGRDI